jgi:hypothetical protein
MPYYGRRRTYSPRKSSGTQQSTKPIIFWDGEKNKYIIKTPFTDAFKNQLMVLCHSAMYLGKTEGAFAINAEDLENAKVVVEALFGEFDFIPKEEREQAKFSMTGSAANNAAIALFTIAGPEIARKYWLNVIKQFHTDLNGDSANSDKAAQINVAWDQLKKELGW